MIEKKRVLVVDDEPNIVALIRKYLEEAGYFVEEAGDGLAAWEMLQNADYDIVVSDLLMPELNGPELVRRIRNDNQLANLPFVLLSVRAADVSQEEIVEWHKGSNGVIVKPFYLDEFVWLVNRVLQEPDKIFDLFLDGSGFRKKKGRSN